MTNVDDVITGVYRALKNHGRFVGEFGGMGNVATIVDAMSEVFHQHPEFGEFSNPWYFPSAEQYQQKLEAQGFLVQSIELTPRPTILNSGIKQWLTIFSNGITCHLSEQQRARFIDQVEHRVKPYLYLNGQWQADYVRLRFYAQK